MQLEDLKQSISSLPNEEALAIHMEIRQARLTAVVTTQKKAQAKKRTTTTKSMKEVAKDPEKIKELLRLLGEDV